MNNLFLTLLCILSFASLAQQSTATPHPSIKYYGLKHFLLEGSYFNDSLKEHPLQRLPLVLKNENNAVWNISKTSTGMSLSFFSNSSFIYVKYSITSFQHQNNMAETGSRGVDLYFKNNGEWQYLKTLRPSGTNINALLIGNMSPELREYRLYLPLYAEVLNLEIGIDKKATIYKSEKSNYKPIVFYGTSITQGGCASRPGSAHTNIISRKMGIECLNYGFHGQGKMDPKVIDHISNIDASFFVIECLPNMTVDELNSRTVQLVATLQAAHPLTPIIFVENFIYDYNALDTVNRKETNMRNTTLNILYEKMVWELGLQNLYLFNGYNEQFTEHDATVDGIHFNEIGFKTYAEYLLERLNYFSIPLKVEY